MITNIDDFLLSRAMSGGGGKTFPEVSYETLFENPSGVNAFTLNKPFTECKLLRFTSVASGGSSPQYHFISGEQLATLQASPGIFMVNVYNTTQYLSLNIVSETEFTQYGARSRLISKVEEVVCNGEMTIDRLFTNSSWNANTPTNGITIDDLMDYDYLLIITNSGSEDECTCYMPRPIIPLNGPFVQTDDTILYAYNKIGRLLINQNTNNIWSNLKIYLISGIKMV